MGREAIEIKLTVAIGQRQAYCVISLETIQIETNMPLPVQHNWITVPKWFPRSEKAKHTFADSQLFIAK